MKNLLVKLFIKDYNNTSDPLVRGKYGSLAGIIGILSNLILCAIKLTFAFLTMSQSILADGINNLTDAGSSIITLIGFKLSSAPADEEHPFGHERIEYITGLIISFLIVLIGFSIGKESIENLINHKAPNNFTIWTIIAMVISIIIKLWQSIFYRKMAKSIDSEALVASSKDSLNDCISTTAVIIGLILFKWLNITWVDSAIGLIVSIFILISGFKMIIDTINPLIGVMPSQELIDKITQKILSYDGVLGIHDLVIHHYGKCTTFATVHIEVDCNVDVMISHDQIDNIEKDIKQEFNVLLTGHLDPIDINNPETIKLKILVSNILNEINPALSMHDFRVVHGITHTNLLFDVAVPAKFELTHSEIRNKISDQIKMIDEKYIAIIEIDQLYINK